MSQLEDPCKRVTNQREAIVCHLKKNKTHPSAQEIFEHVKKQLPRISRGTVYRNLDSLSEEGIVREVHVSGTTRFEYLEEGMHHDHFVCDSCNTIIDIQLPDVEKQTITQLKKKYPGFVPKAAVVNITGTCKKCNGGKNHG